MPTRSTAVTEPETPLPPAEGPPEGAEPPHRTRASALPPAERRAEIVAATLPLLLEHGRQVTTRQIAEASGVAEGTIFRVFADKEALIDSVLEAALDPGPAEAALRAVDRALPLEQRLAAAVDIQRARIMTIWELITAVGPRVDADGTPMMPPRKPPDLGVLAELFEPDRDQLRREPMEAAHLLRGLVLSGTHPSLVWEQPLSSEEIVSLLLDGVRVQPHASPHNSTTDEGTTDRPC